MTEPTYTDYAIAFCKVFQVTEADLTKPGCKKAAMVSVRRALWTTLHEAGYTYSFIGRNTGRDHSTVIHGINRYAVEVHGRGFLAKVDEARALVPEIATQRAAGVRFDLIGERRPEDLKPAPALKPVLPMMVPREKARQLLEDVDGYDWERQMRAQVRKGDARFAEALRQEVGA